MDIIEERLDTRVRVEGAGICPFSSSSSSTREPGTHIIPSILQKGLGTFLHAFMVFTLFFLITGMQLAYAVTDPDENPVANADEIAPVQQQIESFGGNQSDKYVSVNVITDQNGQRNLLLLLHNNSDGSLVAGEAGYRHLKRGNSGGKITWTQVSIGNAKVGADGKPMVEGYHIKFKTKLDGGSMKLPLIGQWEKTDQSHVGGPDKSSTARFAISHTDYAGLHKDGSAKTIAGQTLSKADYDHSKVLITSDLNGNKDMHVGQFDDKWTLLGSNFVGTGSQPSYHEDILKNTANHNAEKEVKPGDLGLIDEIVNGFKAENKNKDVTDDKIKELKKIKQKLIAKEGQGGNANKISGADLATPTEVTHSLNEALAKGGSAVRGDITRLIETIGEPRLETAVNAKVTAIRNEPGTTVDALGNSLRNLNDLLQGVEPKIKGVEPKIKGVAHKITLVEKVVRAEASAEITKQLNDAGTDLTVLKTSTERAGLSAEFLAAVNANVVAITNEAASRTTKELAADTDKLQAIHKAGGTTAAAQKTVEDALKSKITIELNSIRAATRQEGVTKEQLTQLQGQLDTLKTQAGDARVTAAIGNKPLSFMPTSDIEATITQLKVDARGDDKDKAQKAKDDLAKLREQVGDAKYRTAYLSGDTNIITTLQNEDLSGKTLAQLKVLSKEVDTIKGAIGDQFKGVGGRTVSRNIEKAIADKLTTEVGVIRTATQTAGSNIEDQKTKYDGLVKEWGAGRVKEALDKKPISFKTDAELRQDVANLRAATRRVGVTKGQLTQLQGQLDTLKTQAGDARITAAMEGEKGLISFVTPAALGAKITDALSQSHEKAEAAIHNLARDVGPTRVDAELQKIILGIDTASDVNAEKKLIGIKAGIGDKRFKEIGGVLAINKAADAAIARIVSNSNTKDVPQLRNDIASLEKYGFEKAKNQIKNTEEKLSSKAQSRFNDALSGQHSSRDLNNLKTELIETNIFKTIATDKVTAIKNGTPGADIPTLVQNEATLKTMAAAGIDAEKVGSAAKKVDAALQTKARMLFNEGVQESNSSKLGTLKTQLGSTVIFTEIVDAKVAAIKNGTPGADISTLVQNEATLKTMAAAGIDAAKVGGTAANKVYSALTSKITAALTAAINDENYSEIKTLEGQVGKDRIKAPLRKEVNKIRTRASIGNTSIGTMLEDIITLKGIGRESGFLTTDAIGVVEAGITRVARSETAKINQDMQNSNDQTDFNNLTQRAQELKQQVPSVFAAINGDGLLREISLKQFINNHTIINVTTASDGSKTIDYLDNGKVYFAKSPSTGTGISLISGALSTALTAARAERINEEVKNAGGGKIFSQKIDAKGNFIADTDKGLYIQEPGSRPLTKLTTSNPLYAEGQALQQARCERQINVEIGNKSGTISGEIVRTPSGNYEAVANLPNGNMAKFTITDGGSTVQMTEQFKETKKAPPITNWIEKSQDMWSKLTGNTPDARETQAKKLEAAEEKAAKEARERNIFADKAKEEAKAAERASEELELKKQNSKIAKEKAANDRAARKTSYDAETKIKIAEKAESKAASADRVADAAVHNANAKEAALKTAKDELIASKKAVEDARKQASAAVAEVKDLSGGLEKKTITNDKKLKQAEEALANKADVASKATGQAALVNKIALDAENDAIAQLASAKSALDEVGGAKERAATTASDAEAKAQSANALAVELKAADKAVAETKARLIVIKTEAAKAENEAIVKSAAYAKSLKDELAKAAAVKVEERKLSTDLTQAKKELEGIAGKEKMAENSARRAESKAMAANKTLEAAERKLVEFEASVRRDVDESKVREAAAEALAKEAIAKRLAYEANNLTTEEVDNG